MYIFFFLVFLLPLTKLLDTTFDSKVFIDGVNAKRKLEIMDATKIS